MDVDVYRRMSVTKATAFKQRDKGLYSTYLCNIGKAVLMRNDSDEHSPCVECTYLVNEKKRSISLMELMHGKYDVIFVSSDVDEQKNF